MDVCFLHSFSHFSPCLWSLTSCAAQTMCDLAALVLLQRAAQGHIHVHLYTGQEGGINIFSSDSFMGHWWSICGAEGDADPLIKSLWGNRSSLLAMEVTIHRRRSPETVFMFDCFSFCKWDVQLQSFCTVNIRFLTYNHNGQHVWTAHLWSSLRWEIYRWISRVTDISMYEIWT